MFPTPLPNPAEPGTTRGLRSLVYRYFFFDWLFADMREISGVIERHAAWQHNRAMRKHLPVYLRRWTALATLMMLLGGLCERVFEAAVLAACCFTGFGITVSGMSVIAVAWLFLARSQGY